MIKFNCIEIHNKTFRKIEKATPIEITDSNIPIVQKLRSSKYIKERPLEGNISSFNFTRKAFANRNWNELTTKARGLFINVKTGEIVARSYEKFFNYGERPETQYSSLKQHLKFPVCCYGKENGYLGIVGYNSEVDDLLVCTKSTTQSNHVEWFKDLLYKTHPSQIKHIVKDKNLSLIFEVVDPVNDPHIIKYDNAELVLLDAIYREEQFKKVDYKDLKSIAKHLKFSCKQLPYMFADWEFFSKFIYDIQNDNIDNPVFNHEGFVVEDAEGFQFKLKTPYYTMWKRMRGVLERLQKGRPHLVKTGSFQTPLENNFYGFLKKQSREYLQNKNIIQLREEYYGIHN